MDAQETLVKKVLDCANRIAHTSLHLQPDGDISLQAFGFDSLSLFAFILELERTVGMEFDEALLHHEDLSSIRSTAALIAARGQTDAQAG